MERRRLAGIILPARKACRLATSPHRSILVFRLPILRPQGNRQPETVLHRTALFRHFVIHHAIQRGKIRLADKSF